MRRAGGADGSNCCSSNRGNWASTKFSPAFEKLGRLNFLNEFLSLMKGSEEGKFGAKILESEAKDFRRDNSSEHCRHAMPAMSKPTTLYLCGTLSK